MEQNTRIQLLTEGPYLSVASPLSQIQHHPSGVGIAAVAGVFGAAINPGFTQVVLQRGAQPDLVEELVARVAPIP